MRGGGGGGGRTTLPSSVAYLHTKATNGMWYMAGNISRYFSRTLLLTRAAAGATD